MIVVLGSIWLHIFPTHIGYQEHKVGSRHNELKVSMYFATHQKFPCLTGKAAEVKHLGPALLSAFSTFMDADNAQHKQVKLLLQMAVKMDQVMDDYKDVFRLPPEKSAAFRDAAFAFVQITSALGHYYHPRNIMLFNFTIKFHYILHLGLSSQWMNPRRVWCYGGEDMMQLVKRIAAGSLAGSDAAAVLTKVVRKYTQGLGLDLSRKQGRR